MSQRLIFLLSVLADLTLFAGCSSSPTAPASQQPTAPARWRADLFGGSFTSIWGTSPEALQVTSGPLTLSYDGSNWYPHATGSLDFVNDIWSSAADNVYATTATGNVLHFDGAAWDTSITTSKVLHTVWGTGPDNVYVGGSDGLILHYDGSSWSPLSTGVAWEFVEIWGTGPNDVFALSQEARETMTFSGSFLHYDGSTWETRSLNNAKGIQAVWGPGPGTIYLSDNQGTILGGDGTNFTPYTTPLDTPVVDIAGLSSGTVFGITSSHLYTLLGSAPAIDPGETIYDLWTAPWGTVYAVGQAGTVLTTDGSDWTLMHGANPNYSLRTVFGSSAEDIFAIGSAGGFHFDGSSWTPLSLSSNVLAGAAATMNFAVVVGSGGAIETWDGDSWQDAQSPTTVGLDAVYAASSNDVFAAGESEVIVHYDGSQWSQVYPSGASSGQLYGIHGSSGNDVFACGENGEVLHFDGTNWSSMSTPTSLALRSVWAFSANDAIAVGESGTILHFDGAQWVTMPIATTDYLWGIWADSANDVYVAATSGSMFHYDGSTWSPFTAFPLRGPRPLWAARGRLYTVSAQATVMSIAIQ